MDHTVSVLLAQARAGDQGARENLIGSCRSFVQQTAGALANRSLEWSRDDELSIALIALNEAIDLYQPQKRVPFLAFARIVIHSRLIDFWRKENRFYQQTLLINENGNTRAEQQSAAAWESQSAWDRYLEEQITWERAEEIQRFQQLLRAFRIDFSELVKVSPQHRDSRQTSLRVARYLAQTPRLMEFLQFKKQLPVQELTEQMGLNRKTIERWRKYIIALTLILHSPNEFSYLKTYLQIPVEGGCHDE